MADQDPTAASARHRPRRVLVTGGMGFIGANLVRHLLGRHPEIEIINLDALTYAGNPANLAGLPPDQEPRHRFVHGDISDAALVERLFADQRPDTVIHLAAESHVDRSIDDPLAFVRTNLVGTAVLLHAARAAWRDRQDVRFHHISTDEVFGSLGSHGLFSEGSAYDPSSPYSATKAGSDHLVRAWGRTYGMPVTISNCSNNYGPYHFPEKLIPLMIANALAGKPLPVYGDGAQVRDWLYVEDHARAIDLIVRQAEAGTTWTVGGRNEWKNLDLVQLLCDLLEELAPSGRAGGYRAQIAFVADRPGHDRRYAIDASRIERELGWRPRETFESGLRKTVAWYLGNQAWVSALVESRQATARRGLGAPPSAPA